MARSKRLHQITVKFPVSQAASGTIKQDMFDGGRQIDIADHLSSALGRTIKQMNNFRLVGWGASLRPAYISPGEVLGLGSDLYPETGFGAQIQIDYVPTTKSGKKGVMDLARHYWKQSNFRKGLGVNTRYDEFEMAYNKHTITNRTSEVYVGGINDSMAEHAILLGDYDDEDGLGQGYIAAQHLFDAKNPIPSAGVLEETDLLFDDEVRYKSPKFASYFPRPQTLAMAATLSSQTFYNHDILIDDIYSTGGVAHSDCTFLPEGNHIDVMAGLMNAHCYISSPDDENFLGDGAYVYITLFIEGWSSLYPSKKGGKKIGRKSTRRKSRRSRK